KIVFASKWKVAAAVLLLLATAVGLARQTAARPLPPGGKAARSEPPAGLGRRLPLARAVERALAWHGRGRPPAEVRRQVEKAYWELSGEYRVLHTREQGLRSAHEAFQIVEARFQAGRVAAADKLQARGQYELFR